jgi:hypothetical protein
VRNHPHVNAVATRLGIGYEDALALVRSQAADPVAVAAIKDIDAARAAQREQAKAKNTDMGKRLGLDLSGIAGLVETLADDPELETWLVRRVNLMRASGVAPTHEEHPENE